MKDDLNDEVLDGTPKTLIPSDGVLKYDGVSKLGGRPKKDYLTKKLGWIITPITRNSI
jgi:hypothetical protein